MRHSHPAPAALLLAAALLPGLARGAGPAPVLPTQPVGKGAVLRVDLSKLPSSLTRKGTATCAGSRITATGEAEELRCERPFTFDAPVGLDPLVILFEPKGGGAPVRLEYPLAWDPRPKLYTAPAEGTLRQLLPAPPAPAKAGAAPAPPPSLPPEQLAMARAAGATSCGQCPGKVRFELKDVALAPAPPGAFEVIITVQPGPGGS